MASPPSPARAEEWEEGAKAEGRRQRSVLPLQTLRFLTPDFVTSGQPSTCLEDIDLETHIGATAMYRRYCKGDPTWAEGLQSANEFIGRQLYRHVTTWPRYGHLGVQDGLNCTELCARLPSLVESRGEFGLLFDDTNVRLLIIEVGARDGRVALCYGPWPGVETWESVLEPHLSPGLTLSCSFWNRMPRLADAGALTAAETREAWVEARRAA